MLTDTQLQQLNKQIAIEENAARFYLALSCWATTKGLHGAANFFRSHHEQEDQHMHKLQEYVLATGGKISFPTVDSQADHFEGIIQVLKLCLEKETHVSQAVNKLVDSFLAEKDYSTFNFLQWYVAEQHEEENLFKTLIEKAEMIGEDGRGIYWIDKELSSHTA